MKEKKRKRNGKYKQKIDLCLCVFSDWAKSNNNINSFLLLFYFRKMSLKIACAHEMIFKHAFMCVRTTRDIYKRFSWALVFVLRIVVFIYVCVIFVGHHSLHFTFSQKKKNIFIWRTYLSFSSILDLNKILCLPRYTISVYTKAHIARNYHF